MTNGHLRRALTVLGLGGLLLSSAPAAHAAALNFDSLSDLTQITDQFASGSPGVTFGYATARGTDPLAMVQEYPPHSGSYIAFDEDGPLTGTFSSPVNGFQAYFTYRCRLTITAKDASGNVVATVQSQKTENYTSSGNTPNELITVVAAGGPVIKSFTIQGDEYGDSFAMDDFSPLLDTTKPTCTIGAVVVQSASRVYVPITAADGQSGVATVQLTSNSANVVLEAPDGSSVAVGGTLTFSPALGSVVVKAVKVNPAQSARVELRITDLAGNSLLSDPVVDNLQVEKKQLVRIYKNIPNGEYFLKLENGSPGLTSVKVVVNGKQLHTGELIAGQVLQLNAQHFMRKGNRNTIRVVASGPVGAEAILLIGDAALAGGAGNRPGRQGHGRRETLLVRE